MKLNEIKTQEDIKNYIKNADNIFRENVPFREQLHFKILSSLIEEEKGIIIDVKTIAQIVEEFVTEDSSAIENTEKVMKAIEQYEIPKMEDIINHFSDEAKIKLKIELDKPFAFGK